MKRKQVLKSTSISLKSSSLFIQGKIIVRVYPINIICSKEHEKQMKMIQAQGRVGNQIITKAKVNLRSMNSALQNRVLTCSGFISQTSDPNLLTNKGSVKSFFLIQRKIGAKIMNRPENDRATHEKIVLIDSYQELKSIAYSLIKFTRLTSKKVSMKVLKMKFQNSVRQIFCKQFFTLSL